MRRSLCQPIPSSSSSPPLFSCIPCPFGAFSKYTEEYLLVLMNISIDLLGHLFFLLTELLIITAGFTARRPSGTARQSQPRYNCFLHWCVGRCLHKA